MFVTSGMISAKGKYIGSVETDDIVNVLISDEVI